MSVVSHIEATLQRLYGEAGWARENAILVVHPSVVERLGGDAVRLTDGRVLPVVAEPACPPERLQFMLKGDYDRLREGRDG